MPCHICRALERAVPPILEPLTLAETKLYLRVDGCDEDFLIVSLIAAARDAAEACLRRSLMPQSWRLAFDNGIDESVPLPMGPVQQITRLRRIAADGSSNDVSPALYRLDAARTALLVPGGATATTVEIVYVTGYASAEALPAALKAGLLSHVAALYAARGEGGAMPEATLAAYAPYREVRL